MLIGKRSSSQRPSSFVKTSTEKDEEGSQLKLVLKLPVTDKKAREVSIFEECLASETADIVLEILLQINDSVYPSILDNWEIVLKAIKELWQKYQSNSTICSVIVNILTKLLPHVTCLSRDHHNFLLSLLNHDSREVQSLVLKCWVSLVDNLPNEFSTQCIEKAVEVIYDPCHALRMECLNLIGHLNHVTSSQESLLLMVTDFCSDCDPRVRRAAIQSLLTMFKKGVDLDVTVYNKSCDLLQDDDDSVRYVAVQLVYSLGMKLENSTVPLAQDPNIQLKIEDDSFIKICQMITDTSVTVRSLAASLLGDFQHISDTFLNQTLDKKLMSHLRVVKSDHERAREEAGGSRDWDTGQRWGGGVPKLDLNPSEVTLMHSGSCGAFVHSLEDEYMEVRSAAVKSMGQLCAVSPGFATLSLDYLVDMFNDEIESVRLLAINCLRQVSATIHFREDQLETVLGVLQESSQEIREALHDLLSTCHIVSMIGLRLAVHALLDNLRKYPSDCQSIWKCLQNLGNSHSYLVSSLAPELLSAHPYLMTKEPDVNDAAYVCILILVFNAVGMSPTMTSLFPPYVFHHYTYLHDSIPHLIPTIKGLVSRKALTKSMEELPPSSGSYVRQLLSHVLNSTQSHDASVTMETLKQCIRDLDQLGKVEPNLSGCVKFSSQLLQCQLLMMKVHHAVSCVVMVTNDIAADIRELFLLSYRLQWAYECHDPQLLVVLHLLRIIAHSGLILLALKLEWTTEHKERYYQLQDGLVTRIENMKKMCVTHKLSLPIYLQPLSQKLVSMETNQLSSLLQSITQVSILEQLDSAHLISIQKCRAEITSPDHNDDVIHKFLSSLALSLPLNSTIHHLTDCTSIAIKVKLPDGRSLTVTPKLTDFRCSSNIILNTQLILSHGNWTDSSSLKICIVRCYNPDTPTDYNCLEMLNKLCRKGGVARVSAEDCVDDGVGEVVISDAVKVNIHPQETLSKSFNVFGST